MSNKTLLLIVFLFSLTATLVVIALRPKNTPSVPTVGGVPTPTPVAQSLLSFNPNPIAVSSTSGSVNIEIDTAQNMVTGVQLELEYDPKILTNVDIKPGSFLPNAMQLLKEVDSQNGSLSYALVLAPNTTPQKGTGTVATVTFSVLNSTQPQTTKISFTPRTLVTASGISVSVLKTVTQGTIVIGTTTPTVSTRPASPSSTTR